MTNQQVQSANRSSNPSAGQKGGAMQTNNDYINHYLAGKTIFYIYRITPYTNQETGEITHFFKANMKTGAKKGDTYIPCEGTLSPPAVENLDGIFDLVNSEDESVRRTAGVTVKAPRFEGANAFITNDDKQALRAGKITIDDIKPVSISKFRIHNIENMRLFKKKDLDVSDGATPEQKMKEQVEKLRTTG